jgi:hypothetical protein
VNVGLNSCKKFVCLIDAAFHIGGDVAAKERQKINIFSLILFFIST